MNIKQMELLSPDSSQDVATCMMKTISDHKGITISEESICSTTLRKVDFTAIPSLWITSLNGMLNDNEIMELWYEYNT
jgi:hypothetical protein